MGNNLTKAIDKWGLNPRKFSSKSRRAKGKAKISRPNEQMRYLLHPQRKVTNCILREDAPARPPHQPPDAHLYDTVPDMPVYSVVNKKKQRQEEVHYAEVQVLQSHSGSSRGGQRPYPESDSTTEYATIDFNGQPPPPSATSRGSSLRPSISSKPADILIPPGNLQRPIPNAVRKGSSKKAVVV